jgi:ADP-ribose pyrophosphatase
MKIPKNAKRVFKGEIFDVYQWQQKLFDGSYSTFERIKRQDSVQIIPVEGSKILLADEKQPDRKRRINFVGGRIDRKETPLATAKRELKEETGCEAEQWLLFKNYNPLSKIDWNIYYFIAIGVHKVSSQSLDAGEKITIKKVSLDEFFRIVGRTKNEFSFDMHLIQKDKKKLAQFRRQLGL